jgi:ribosomal protein L11 methyltransferase
MRESQQGALLTDPTKSHQSPAMTPSAAISLRSDASTTRPASGRRYAQVSFKVRAAMADEAAAILVARGALGCAVKMPRSGSPSGARPVTLEAFFRTISAAEVSSVAAILKTLRLTSPRMPPPEIRRIEDPGWATMWMTRFKPLRIGRRWLIVPPWSKTDAQGRLRMIIKPGQAFGTGHHPTTRGCLIALEREFSRRRFGSVLDVGTGSGILALAAQMLGARRIVGIDTDKVALANATENASLNGLTGTVGFSSAALPSLRRRFELITANITGGTLTKLASRLKALLADDGRLILSGIRRQEVSGVLRHFRPQLRCVRSRTEQGWTTLTLASR